MIGACKQGKDVEGSWRSGVGCQGTCEKEGDGDGRGKKKHGKLQNGNGAYGNFERPGHGILQKQPLHPAQEHLLRNRLPTNNAPLPPL